MSGPDSVGAKPLRAGLGAAAALETEGSLRIVRAGNRSPMTLDGTRTFIVGRDEPVVIDPGPDDPAHVDAVLAALGGARPIAILLTHSHGDHAGAAPALAERSGALVWGGGKEAARWGATETLHEGRQLGTDDGTITAVATPGHAPDHFCFLWSDGDAPVGGAVFVGDMMLGLGFTTFVGSPSGDVAAYFASLDRLERIAPAILYPAHGPALTDPPNAIRRYREHRIARVAQVAERMKAHPAADAAELASLIYGQLDPRLRRAAEDSVRAMVEYLQRETPASTPKG